MEKPSACTIHLIRHGETDWNLSGRWQGHGDVPLNAAGRGQAGRLARRFAQDGMRFDALFSSDLSRAWETAEIIGGALGMAPVAAPALREIDLGAWSGMTRPEIAQAFPGEWLRIQNNEDLPRGGGETLAAFQQRVMDWLNRTAEQYPGRTVCAVTHGGCIRTILLHAQGLSWASRGQIPEIRNASICVVEGGARGWKIKRLNGSTQPPETGKSSNGGIPL